MAAPCTVCSHPDRTAIDAALVQGEGNTAVGERHGLHKDAVRRHKASHLSPALKAVVTKRETAGATKALDRMESLYQRTSAILDAAERDGQAALSLAAVKELRGLVMDLARMTGEYDDKPVVNVLNVAASPEWAHLRGVMFAALRAHPEAARAVAAALAGTETDVAGVIEP